MRNYLLTLSCLLLAIAQAARAQNGCTDPTAVNYNAAATSNDGSCVYSYTHYNPALRAVFGTTISESSGIVFTDGKLWTHNDSGNPADIFRIDTSSGAVLQTVRIDNFANEDWEDIAADSGFFYIADCGNNNGTRKDLRILKIAKADIGTAATVHVNAQAILFSYADQANFTSNALNNFDCEALIAIRDSLYIFTKDRGDAQTRVYKMPKTPGTYALTPYTSFNTGGLITGADYNYITGEIALIGYSLTKYNSFLWLLNDYRGNQFFSGNKRKIDINNGGEWQTEGICWLPGSRLAISCETSGPVNASLYTASRAAIWQPAATAAPGMAAAAPGIAVYPNPAGDLLLLSGGAQASTYSIFDAGGKPVLRGSLRQGGVGIHTLAPGAYFISLADAAGVVLHAGRFEKAR